jgi:hypothetical protein
MLREGAQEDSISICFSKVEVHCRNMMIYFVAIFFSNGGNKMWTHNSPYKMHGGITSFNSNREIGLFVVSVWRWVNTNFLLVSLLRVFGAVSGWQFAKWLLSRIAYSGLLVLGVYKAGTLAHQLVWVLLFSKNPTRLVWLDAIPVAYEYIHAW